MHWCLERSSVVQAGSRWPAFRQMGQVYGMELCDASSAYVESPEFRCGGGLRHRLIRKTSGFRGQGRLCNRTHNDCREVFEIGPSGERIADDLIEVRPEPTWGWNDDDACTVMWVEPETSCCNAEGRGGGGKYVYFDDLYAQWL